MTIETVFRRLIRDEDGAVTVDWVVLTAAICFLAVTVIAGIQRATLDTSRGIEAAIVNKGSAALNEDVYP